MEQQSGLWSLATVSQGCLREPQPSPFYSGLITSPRSLIFLIRKLQEIKLFPKGFGEDGK